MGSKILDKPKVHLFIILLVIINVLLLSYFLKSPTEERLLSNNKYNLELKDFPEIEALKDSNLDFQKSAEFFRNLSVKRGGEYGYKALAAAANFNYLSPNVDSHLLGHTVGDVLYKQQGIDGIKVCTDDLRNACSHSIVVGFLLEKGEDSLVEAVSKCEDAPGGKGAYTMCVHGLGHGVLGYVEYDMRKAVSLCEKTGTKKYGYQEVGQCIGGVSMEMMAGVHDRDMWLTQLPNYFKSDDPLAPCSMDFMPENGVGYCYMYLTPHLFEVAGASLANPESKYFSKAMSYCEALEKGNPNRNICFGNFGKEFVVLANSRNVQSVTLMKDDKLKLIHNWCNLGPKEAALPCVSSALQSLYWGGENDPDVSIRFCNNALDNKQEGICITELIGAVSFYKRDDLSYKKSFCNNLKDKYRNDCNNRLITKI